MDFAEFETAIIAIANNVVEYEYRREAYFAFEEMKKRINRDIVRLLRLSRIERGADGGLIIQFA